MSEKPDIQESRKKGFEHIELPAKLLDYFLRSNKSNINQLYIYIYTYVDSERDIQCNTLQHIGHTLQHTMLTWHTAHTPLSHKSIVHVDLKERDTENERGRHRMRERDSERKKDKQNETFCNRKGHSILTTKTESLPRLSLLSYSYVWKGHGTHVNVSCHSCEWFMSNIWMRHFTHIDE